MPVRLPWLWAWLLIGCALPICAQSGAVVPTAPPVLVLQGVGMAPLRALADICGASLDST